MALALATMEAASAGSAVFRRTRSSTIDRDEEIVNPNLGLDPADTEALAWKDQNRAEVAMAAGPATS